MRQPPHWLAALLFVAAVPAQRGLNLLFYGNSFSIDNYTVTRMVSAIAGETGVPAPTVVPRLFGGRNLAFHRYDPAQVAAISTSLPPGEQWDFVVMQGHSLEATAGQGDPAAFRANAVGIVANVRAHSPNARAILYQTWAYAFGHAQYPAGFPEPWAMHAEVRANYQRAAADIDNAFGPGTARLARAGDAVARLGFDPVWYNPDRSHPGVPMTVVASMAIYSAIYGTPMCAVNPDFTSQSPLPLHFATYSFPPAAWTSMQGYADVVAARAQRRFPGSDEDLLLRSGAPGAETPCSPVTVLRGANLSLALTSPGARYAQPLAVLFLDALRAAPHPSFPELHVDPAAAVAVAATARLGVGLTASLPVPATLRAMDVLVQGAVLAPSAAMANPWFTTTDGQELRIR